MSEATPTTTTERQLLTHSRLSCWRSCPRKHYLRYELGLAPDTDSFALRVGTAFHAALEAHDLGRDPTAAISARGDLDPFDHALVAAMFNVHVERWQGDTLEVVATELQFEIPLRNPETGKPSTNWNLAGKIDRIYRLPDGRLAVQDYKTSSEDLGADSTLWTRLRLDSQMSIYLIAARELGYDVDTILYDVTKRPTQRPLKATPEAERKYTKAGALYANQRGEDETVDAYFDRVMEAMRADPDRYFARYEIARTQADLDETLADVWTQQMAMRESQRSGRWYRNPGACTSIGVCSYLPICESRIDVSASIPRGFKLLPSVHAELNLVPE